MQIPEIVIVKDRPVPKDVLQFYGVDNSSKRLIVTVTDSVETWQKDLSICERLFGDIVICPFASSYNNHKSQIEKTQDILKQRMKHPDVSGNPALEAIAKTWILPQKVHLGADATTFLDVRQDPIKDFFVPFFDKLQTVTVIHFLKIEVPDGMERRLIYSFLDEGFRPSMLLIKWSADLDEDVPTAHCAGHLMNSGYSLIYNNNGYALYYFHDQTLYDVCSIKEPSLQNPFLKTILGNTTEQIKASMQTQVETQIETKKEELS